MKKLALLLLIIVFQLSAQIPAGYYDNAQGLTGYQLKTALKNIISNGHQDQGYDALYTCYQDSDTDNYYENDQTVLDMYSEKPNGPDAYEYQHISDKCGNYSGEGACYNREHLVPQSVFGSASPMKSDAHFVVPTDGYVNNRRSSYAFGEVSNPTWTSTNGSKLGPNSTQGYTGTVFEPIDEFKGDIARMLFYFATRYEDQVSGWSHAMLNGSSDQVFSNWFLDILLSWHYNDPVSQREIDRNNAVYNFQHNRNPYIDHPEWVAQIWDPTPDTVPPTAPTNLSAQNITDTSVTLNWTEATDNVGVESYQIFQNANLIGDTSSTTYDVFNLQANTTYQFCIKAIDASGNISNCSNTITITTGSAPYYVINEDFTNCPNIQFFTISEASDKDWTCISQYGENNSPAIQINGYQENEPSKDWLITTQKINFDNYTNEKLSVFLVSKYGSTPLELVYSSDYDGGMTPSAYTWTSVPNINIPLPNGSTQVESIITDEDISPISGNVYLAFKYFSNGSPTRWTVDSFKIKADNSSTIQNITDNKVHIFPNPLYASQKLHINLLNHQIIEEIEIFDISGKVILSMKTNAQQINLSRLNPGLYLLKIKTNEGIALKKLIIK